MNVATVVSIGQQSLEVTIMLAAPIMGSSMVVGLIISMLQAATQITEQTLSFVPKLLTIAIVLIVLGKWMLNVIVGFTTRLYENIPNLIG
mgnify:CR=1 FL=1